MSHRVAGLAFLLVTALLVGFSTPAHAATTYFVDGGDPGCDDSTVDSSTTPYCTINAAIADAIDGDTIEVAAGTYTNSVPTVVFIDNKDLTINGAGQGVTIIDGQDTRRGVGVSAATVTITDLTIQNGLASGGSGGNVLVYSSSSLQLTDVTIDGGAAASGGGLAVINTSSASLLRVTISNNSASAGIGSGGGGGVHLTQTSTLDVTASTFSANTSVGHGGAIAALQSGNVTIDGSTFTGNSTTTGQGGAVVFHSTVATYSISDSTFNGNTAVIGGGAVATGDGVNTITGSYFTLNSATGYGGALFHEGADNLLVTNTTFYDNDAGTDGGAARGDGFYVNVTFSANTAGGNGGAVARTAAFPNIANSILFGNSATGLGNDCYQITSEGHNLIGDATNCVQNGDTTGNVTGSDPALSAPANNGGPTFTMKIAFGSPARNAGNADAFDPTDWDASDDAGDGDWSCAALDQRGVSRDNPRCDIGAYEYDLSQPVGLVDPQQGYWYLRQGTQSFGFYFGNPGDYPFAGDWDCNGIDTPGLYRQSDGYVYLRNTNTQGVADITFFFGNPGDVPIIGDFDDDGCDTVSIYRPSEQRFYIINALGINGGGLGQADYFYDFGNPGDQPFAGDFDGDGFDEIGLHRASTGLVYYEDGMVPNTGGGQADHQFFFGDPGDRFVAGDWNADNADSPAIYRPSDTTFYFRYTNTQGNADETATWGESDWIPIAGIWAP